jgi:putative transposase
LQPHKSAYQEFPNIYNWEDFSDSVGELCELNAQAAELYKKGIHLISTDKKTEIRALERANPTMRMKVGNCEKQEFNYIRHGTQVLIGNLEIATGKVFVQQLEILEQKKVL